MIIFSLMPENNVRINKRLAERMWQNFLGGKAHFSPSGFTAAYLANRATREGVTFTLKFSKKHQYYTIKRYSR